MKNLITFLILSVLAAGSVLGQPHVMSLTTIGDSKFDKYIVLKASREGTPVLIDYGDGNLVPETIGTKQVWFLNTLAGSTYAKVYGDSIISLWALGEVTSLDISGNPDLRDLNCAGGKLTELDLTKNEALESVDCSLNSLTAINLFHHYALKSLCCSRNKLTAIDLAALSGLGSLECGFNQLTEVDVSGNPLLWRLDCEGNALTGLDLSQNPEITNLSCYSNHIQSLDLTNNQKLTTLRCYSNRLHTLNLSGQTKLFYLDCHDNLLTELDVQRNKNLHLLFCNDNLLDFSSLPERQPMFQVYQYAPQKPLPITSDMAAKGIIDLERLYKPGYATSEFLWKLKNGTSLIVNRDYVCSGGRTVFFRIPGDSVYCEIENRQFGDLSDKQALKTEMIRIIGSRASVVMHTHKKVGDTVTFILHTDTSAIPIEIDFGDGMLNVFMLDTPFLKISHSINGTGYLVISGGHLKGLNVAHNELNGLFIDPELLLDSLNCEDNQLVTLDVNPNNAFHFISCRYNRLDFSTLPVPQSAWKNYLYAPQQPIWVLPDTALGSETDLSDQFIVKGKLSEFSWITKTGKNLTEQIDYVVANGITTFVSDPLDSVYCSMTNPVFPAFVSNETLKTRMQSIRPLDPQMTFHIRFQPCQRCQQYSVSYFLAADADSTPVTIKYGDNIPLLRYIGTRETRLDFTSTYKPDIKVNLAGRGLSSFRSISYEIEDVDFTANPFLRRLHYSGGTMQYIDLRRNRLLTELELAHVELNILDVQYNVLLKKLDCSHNSLLVLLDVSNNKELKYLNCSNDWLNKLNVHWNNRLDTLICSGNGLSLLDVSEIPDLSYLECSDNKLTRLDISGNGKLEYLGCSGNLLDSLDLTTAIDLSSLDCAGNKLQTLNLTYTPKLTSLKCGFNSISSLSLKNNPLLKSLYCESNSLKELDISQCDSLQLVECLFNKIESLDLSRLYELTSLNVVENNLTELDISHNTKLKNCWYYGNRLTFATIPPPWPTWEWYVYAPQQPIFIKPSIAIDDSIDLGDQFRIGNDTTVFVWKDASGTPLLEGTDYLIRNGVTRFLLVQPDSVYGEMSNSLLPQFDEYKRLVTTRTRISIPSLNKTIENTGIRILYSYGHCFLDAPFGGTYRLFDMTGRLVADGIVQKGLNEITYPQTGVYMVTLSGPASGLTGKIVL